MILAGKSPPEKQALEFIEKKTVFDSIELYLEVEHLENFEETVKLLEESELNVASVHTPHVNLSELRYFSIADRLTRRFDAFLVCHSKQILHTSIPEVEEHGLDSPYGYENQPGASLRHLKAAILERENNMVLDTAHLYTAEEDYLQMMENLLSRYSGQIPLIHLCDSTLTDDGLPFGKGDMDMKKTCKKISESDFNGILVFEVLPEHQQEALEKWREWIK